MQVMEKEYAEKKIVELEYTCKVRPTLQSLGELGGCYFTLDRPKEALPLMEYVANLQSNNPDLFLNVGVTLKDLGRHEESFKVMEHAYHLNPDNFYIRLAYGEALLRAGFWKQAWPIYDNARPTQAAAALELGLTHAVKEWDGGKLPEDHLLLVNNEGGAGDRFSYARWLPELTKRGINWKFFPSAPLFSFFERIFPRDRLVSEGEEIPDPTHWTTTFSLPAKLMVSPTEIPPPLRFIPLPEKLERYKIHKPDNLPVIGLCYQAAEKWQGGRKVRSMSEGQAMRLVCATAQHVHWANLNKVKMPFPVNDIPFDSWEDTCGLIANLDAVVSVDTGTLHMAGTLGKPISVVLTGNSDWKFLSKTPKCYWYPTAKLYRNDGAGCEDALNKLIMDICHKQAWDFQKE